MRVPATKQAREKGQGACPGSAPPSAGRRGARGKPKDAATTGRGWSRLAGTAPKEGGQRATGGLRPGRRAAGHTRRGEDNRNQTPSGRYGQVRAAGPPGQPRAPGRGKSTRGGKAAQPGQPPAPQKNGSAGADPPLIPPRSRQHGNPPVPARRTGQYPVTRLVHQGKEIGGQNEENECPNDHFSATHLTFFSRVTPPE